MARKPLSPFQLASAPKPVNIVKTPQDEITWERAKMRAREQYLNASGEQFC